MGEKDWKQEIFKGDDKEFTWKDKIVAKIKSDRRKTFSVGYAVKEALDLAEEHFGNPLTDCPYTGDCPEIKRLEAEKKYLNEQITRLHTNIRELMTDKEAMLARIEEIRIDMLENYWNKNKVSKPSFDCAVNFFARRLKEELTGKAGTGKKPASQEGGKEE